MKPRRYTRVARYSLQQWPRLTAIAALSMAMSMIATAVTLAAFAAVPAAQAQQAPALENPGSAASKNKATPDTVLQIRLVQALADPGRLFPRNETDPKKIPVNPFNADSLRFYFQVR